MPSVSLTVDQIERDVRCGQRFIISGIVEADHDTEATICGSLPEGPCHLVGDVCLQSRELGSGVSSRYRLTLAAQCTPVDETYFTTIEIRATTTSQRTDSRLVGLTVRC